MKRWQSLFAIVGAVALALSFVGLVRHHDQFFESYLFAYVFWFGIAAGSLGLVALHWLVGGAWGRLILPLLEASVQTFPWLALLFLPLCFGLPAIYPWARPALVAAEPVLRHRHLWMNAPFFDLRALLHFVIWALLGFWLARRTLPGSPSAELPLLEKQKRGAIGLILYFLTINFTAVDWMMSIEIAWYSTIYGVLMMISWVFCTLAFMVCALAALKDPAQLSTEIPKKPFWDLGNLTLAFVMLWAYMNFSQYIIIFSANRPDEITWYLARQRGGWFWVAMVLVVFQFFAPFFFLLMRRNKQRLERLVVVSAWIFGLSVLYLFWMIKPSFSAGVCKFHWLDGTTWIGVGGAWLAFFIGQLRRRPVLAWLDGLKNEARHDA